MLQLRLNRAPLSSAMIALSVIFGTLGNSCLAASEEGQSTVRNLCLELRPVEMTVQVGQPLMVEVRLRNCGSQYVVIPPRIFPQATGEKPEPWGVLSFQIQRDDGTRVPYSGEWIGNKLKLPAPQDFIILGPGYFYGLETSLTGDSPFAYALEAPDRYRIVAVLRSSAREWLAQKEEEQLPFDLSSVFVGTLRSEPVLVSVK